MQNVVIPSVKNKSVVLVGGCFDLLHYGHIHFLNTAKKLGDYLIVALESDENVKLRKGQTRPIHTQKQRSAMLSALRSVDEVYELPFMKNDDDYQNMVLAIHPTIIAVTHGDPYLYQKKNQAAVVEATITEIPNIITPSTSTLTRLVGLTD